MLRKTSSLLHKMWKISGETFLQKCLDYTGSQYKRRVQQPFHIDQKRECSPEVRWPLPKARDPKQLADSFCERGILLSLKMPRHVLFRENVTSTACTASLLTASAGCCILRERPSVRCSQWIPLLRVEIHEHVIKNKGNGDGIAQYITVKLVNYLPKEDLDWNIAPRMFEKYLLARSH